MLIMSEKYWAKFCEVDKTKTPQQLMLSILSPIL